MENQSNIWAIDFEINDYPGHALVRACTVNEAISILKSNGSYNSTPNDYNIIDVVSVSDTGKKYLITEIILEPNTLIE
jgi:hypothetical protein